MTTKLILQDAEVTNNVNESLSLSGACKSLSSSCIMTRLARSRLAGSVAVATSSECASVYSTAVKSSKISKRSCKEDTSLLSPSRKLGIMLGYLSYKNYVLFV